MAQVAHDPAGLMNLLAAGGLAVVRIDEHERIVGWDGAAEQMYGYRAQEALGQSIQTLLWRNDDSTDDDLDAYASILGGEAAEFRSWRHRRDGSPFLAELHVTPHFDHGRWVGSTALVRDASAELELIDRLRVAERRFSTAFTAAALPLVICDLDATIVEANDAYRLLATRVEPPALGRFLDLIEPEHRPPIAAALGTLATDPGRFEGIEAPIAGTDNHIVNLSIAPVDEGPDAPPLALVQLIDVSDQLRIQAELAEIATIDPLTGAFNRSCLEPLLASFADGSEVGLLFVDLDHFKEINDSHGHAAGDRILETVGARLDAVVRETDYVIRYGGDEFVIVCPGLADPGAAQRLGDRLRASIATPIDVDDTPITVTASVGASLASAGDAALSGAVEAADASMYLAKTTGRDATVV